MVYKEAKKKYSKGKINGKKFFVTLWMPYSTFTIVVMSMTISTEITLFSRIKEGFHPNLVITDFRKTMLAVHAKKQKLNIVKKSYPFEWMICQ